jgi:hypothetical protein
MTSPRCLVVDTNVFAVAEGMHRGASGECVLSCIRFLRKIDGGAAIAVDLGDEILLEYINTLSSAEVPGLATKLARLLYRTRFGSDTVRRVPITRRDEPPGMYEEVPETLHDFDDDDQKFLAVAVAEGGNPQVLQALDREWYDRYDDLRAAGIDVQFVCLTDLIE